MAATFLFEKSLLLRCAIAISYSSGYERGHKPALHVLTDLLEHVLRELGQRLHWSVDGNGRTSLTLWDLHVVLTAFFGPGEGMESFKAFAKSLVQSELEVSGAFEAPFWKPVTLKLLSGGSDPAATTAIGTP